MDMNGMSPLRISRLGKLPMIASAILMALLAPAGAQTADDAKPAWTVACTDAKDPQTCTMWQRHYPARKAGGQQGNPGTLMVLSVRFAAAPGETVRKPYLLVQLPLGVDLRRGMVMRIDNGNEKTGKFLRCLNTGCEANFLLTDNLVELLKAGRVLRVGFVPLGSETVLVVEASLDGFTKAFNTLR